ncbi:MAG: spore maturation protein [Deltaproteobacteria bacterium]|jgi:spore maturation protein SpmA|nr:spore maturation protein [Deltaproteobacteria bacterium]MBT6491600.1 spore maturation protein [Deltaproteobacteria bacterium]
MLNAIWVVMIVIAVICGALTGTLDAVTKASIDSAKAAVDLAIGLVGIMAFWLGMMRILHHGGLLRDMASFLKPVMVRLFPDVPPEHPAMSMMIMNITSNMLGLGNAATPFGLKAMIEMNKLNKTQGVATNSMCLFLAINTSGLAIFPSGMIGLRAAAGAQYPGSIILTTMMATAISTTVAILSARVLSGLPMFKREALVTSQAQEVHSNDTEILALDTEEAEALMVDEQAEVPAWQKRAGYGLALSVAAALIYALNQKATAVDAPPLLDVFRGVLSDWLLVVLLVSIVIFGVVRGVKVYDAVVEGGKEGFDVALRIIPFLVAILVAVGMLRASGAIGLMVGVLDPFTSMIGMPAETLPMAMLRTLSGSGAYGLSSEIMAVHGADSLIGNIVSTMQGSTETTFYVLALYFGVARIKDSRHALPACLLADIAGVLGAVWACHLLLS